MVRHPIRRLLLLPQESTLQDKEQNLGWISRPDAII